MGRGEGKKRGIETANRTEYGYGDLRESAIFAI